jgi:hypothetical protein
MEGSVMALHLLNGDTDPADASAIWSKPAWSPRLGFSDQ